MLAIMMIAMLMTFAISYEGLSLPLRYSGGKVRIFNVFRTRFEVWSAWIQNIYGIFIISLIFVVILTLTPNVLPLGILAVKVGKSSIKRRQSKLINKGGKSMKIPKGAIEAPHSPLSEMVENFGGRLLLVHDKDVPKEGVVKLPKRPNDAVEGRRFIIFGENAEEVLTKVNHKISRIVGQKIDILKLPGKRLKDLTVPELTLKGFIFRVNRLRELGTVAHGSIIHEDLGIDGAAFISMRLARMIARAYAPTTGDIDSLRRKGILNGFKLSGVGLKGVFWAIPEDEVGAIHVLRRFLTPKNVEKVLVKLNSGADIVLDENTSKLFSKDKTEFSLTLGKTLMLHEVGGSFHPGISFSQALMRWFLLPHLCGINVEPTSEFASLYKKQVMEVVEAFENPLKAAEVVGSEGGDFMELFSAVLKGFGFTAETKGIAMRVLMNALKKRVRKIEIGISEYLVPVSNGESDFVMISPFLARKLSVKDGDIAIIQKSPLLPGDTVILPVKIDKNARGIMVTLEDLPGGWDGDGDKVVVVKADNVFTEPLVAKKFFDSLRERIEELHESVEISKTHGTDKDQAIGKTGIATADAGFTRWMLDAFARGATLTMDEVAEAASVLQVVIDLSNGKVPEDRERWLREVHELEDFNNKEVRNLFKDFPFLEKIVRRGAQFKEGHVNLELPDTLKMFEPSSELIIINLKEPASSIIDLLKSDREKGILPKADIKKIFSIFRSLAADFVDNLQARNEILKEKKVIGSRQFAVRILKQKFSRLDPNRSEEARWHFLFSPIKVNPVANDFIIYFSSKVKKMEDIQPMIKKAEMFFRIRMNVLSRKLNIIQNGYLMKRSTGIRKVVEIIKDIEPDVIINTFKVFKEHIGVVDDRNNRLLTSIINSFLDVITGTKTGDHVKVVSKKLETIREAVDNKWRVWELANIINVDWHKIADHHMKTVDEEVAKKAKCLVINCEALGDDGDDGGDNNENKPKTKEETMRTINVHIDGSSRTDGAGCGFVIEVNGKKTTRHFDLPASYSNNQAEITGLYKVARFLEEHKDRLKPTDEIIIHTDSKLVFNQYNGNWKIKAAGFKEAYDKIHKILDNLPANVSVVWVPREENEEADAASR